MLYAMKLIGMNFKMKILVTGATGFTGKRVMSLLVEKQGIQLRLFTRAQSDVSQFKDYDYEHCVGDFDDKESLLAAMKDCDGLINIASIGFGQKQEQ